MKYIIAIIAIIIAVLLIVYIKYNKEGFANMNYPYIIDISAGANHSVFLNKYGKILPCGKNVNGRLGTGNNLSKMIPVSLENTFYARNVFCGNVNTFFITTDGAVYATGENSKGQLGIGTLDDQFTPIKIPFFNSIPIRKVAPGWYHTVFLTRSGDVYVCGDNKYGQLGNDTNIATNMPIKLDLKCRDIGAGQGHSVFLTTDNKVYTTGWNWYGQLGNSTTRNTKVPLLINITRITSVYTGMSHTILLNDKGNVYVCGDNTNGQLGISQNITNQRAFTLLESISHEKITYVSAGQAHTFFLTIKGDLYGVGLNRKGQLGIGHNNTIYIPEKVDFFKENIMKISAGANHSLFITKDDAGYAVYATGDNTMGGQLSINNITDTNTPVLCNIELEKSEASVKYKTEIVGV